MAPDLAARKVIVAAYIYYCLDNNIMTDGEYDKLCQYVADNWDQLNPVRQWQLGSPDQIRASGFHIRFTVQSVFASRQLYHTHFKRTPPKGPPTSVKRSKETGLRYVTTAPH